jgi:hypothetical protein
LVSAIALHSAIASASLPWLRNSGERAADQDGIARHHRWYAAHLQPISEREAKSLADQYSQSVRRNLGLPVVARPRLRDIQIAPFVSGHDGGLVLGARF